MIIGSRIFDELQDERSICITGALSGGKTRLGFDLALGYWRRGYRVFSNVPHNYDDWMMEGKKDDGTLFKSFCILDEGGEYVRAGKVASSITRSAGKADYYTLFTGKRLPHKDLQRIIVIPRFDFYRNFGIPAILWQAKIMTAEPRYKFVFWQIFPQVIHGTYSTLSSSAGIENFVCRALVTVNRLAEMEGHQAGIQQESGLSGFADDIAEAFPTSDA